MAARNIRLLLEYDGTAYSGWQMQLGRPTVQEALAAAVHKLTGAPSEITGASRTDAGVHAMAQVANFTTGSSIPAQGMMRGLNSALPPDVAVKEAVEVPAGFNARRDAVAKTYLYRVFNRDYPAPIHRRYSWDVFYRLDVDAMRSGAEYFVGERDFSSFRAADCDACHPVREILSFTVGRSGDFVEFEVKGTAFLRHMVRIMVGTLVTLGRGKLKPDDIRAIMEAGDRRKASVTAPPRGLFLKEVEYRPTSRLCR
ncbi:MAG: tRNA pseudouridine(38-40) synthase TruA [Deltaproteobacteria bacterium]|nr:tRNA pseudouridine(38-40) synthase TruA [Deltaproteobacteria bacterium]